MDFNFIRFLTATATTSADAAAQGEATGSLISMFISLGLVLVVCYFFMIRPQNKKDKEQKNMRDNLLIGDEVTTIGGITGIVVRINRNSQNPREDSVVIETGTNRYNIRVKMWAISENLTKHDAVEEAPKKKPKKID